MLTAGHAAVDESVTELATVGALFGLRGGFAFGGDGPGAVVIIWQHRKSQGTAIGRGGDITLVVFHNGNSHLGVRVPSVGDIIGERLEALDVVKGRRSSARGGGGSGLCKGPVIKAFTFIISDDNIAILVFIKPRMCGVDMLNGFEMVHLGTIRSLALARSFMLARIVGSVVVLSD
ncbi:hypothetical protein PG988_003521 [Apiospora saccharicola]